PREDDTIAGGRANNRPALSLFLGPAPALIQSFDAIVLGAGAAGLYCAALAGQRGRRVVVIDHAEEPGRKILISGGGRCNFTNLGTAPD
ncbi:NAD(P)/FAD-dependent oxidoreductase, partial [Streptomyces niveiscabiei]|uniref:NAD(P)/FAD-dependent oxidoreductase n=1 Tax=Streptomyces niveiscabiei TaxID=164115 RepID=UPI0038F6AB2E